MIEKKPTKRDNIGDLKCTSKIVYVPPRTLEEMKTELGSLYEKTTRVAKHYSETDAHGFALLLFLQASEIGQMLGKKKFSAEISPAYKKSSDVVFTEMNKERDEERAKRHEARAASENEDVLARTKKKRSKKK